MRAELAGQELTHLLMRKLNANSHSDFVFSDLHIHMVREIKEKMMYVMPEAKYDWTHTQLITSSLENAYELPDGQLIQVDPECRYGIPELLFQPQLIFPPPSSASSSTLAASLSSTPVVTPASTPWSASNQRNEALSGTRHVYGNGHAMGENRISLPQLLQTSLQKCDPYLQRDLYQNIVLAGGTSMLKGFGERMYNEMMILDGGRHKLEIVQDSQRKYAAWIGGSMFASLSTFNQIQVTRAEYESGRDIIHRKYF
eukprot:TRINITY_DN2493_c0_g1_i6.p1 TRINITY_DN2493_c0_g1~~TRINITY_DN2493_c0_g1_i6.p1  ORF type:complete len:256 (-),score=50.36 TRINITY_DN2493_c0_g1_i6:227-994(-)